ncbi:hypothetical protein Patl1_06193 [Pistacia atlantica]|uniref:Uncharacterized protein n=1 Tax=Pistacia atlantica TaxID=434234 RepID=A0ACC1BVZ8_9ROSI|nr:hypothetical protein Patl1_06193 [Pistacia atlantica]
MENSETSNVLGSRWSLKGMATLFTGNTGGIGFFPSLPFHFLLVEELAGFGAATHTCSRNEAELNQWRIKGFVVSGSVCDVAVSAQ